MGRFQRASAVAGRGGAALCVVQISTKRKSRSQIQRAKVACRFVYEKETRSAALVRTKSITMQAGLAPAPVSEAVGPADFFGSQETNGGRTVRNPSIDWQALRRKFIGRGDTSVKVFRAA